MGRSRSRSRSPAKHYLVNDLQSGTIKHYVDIDGHFNGKVMATGEKIKLHGRGPWNIKINEFRTDGWAWERSRLRTVYATVAGSGYKNTGLHHLRWYLEGGSSQPLEVYE